MPRFISSADAAAAARACENNYDRACWLQISYDNFKDFAVGDGRLFARWAGTAHRCQVRDAYAIATTNEVAQLIHANPPYFVRRTFEFPESGGSLGQTDSGYRFRNNSGEFFVWHNYYRVYLYAP